MTVFTPVSYLFVPGNRPERFDKACAAGADVVILDLEDAVPLSEKDNARDAVAAWLAPGKSVALRINSADTPWHAADLALCGLPGVAAVVVPKAGSAAELARVTEAGAAALLPLIETAAGFAKVSELAGAPQVLRLLFGSIDFSVDLGIGGDDRELDYFRSQLVLASRLAGIAAPVDGVTTAINDDVVLQYDTLRGKRFGFGAKLCIHPRQVAGVHAAYLPDPEEVSWAQRVLVAAASANGAAVAVDGKMVDRPVIVKAGLIMEQAARRR